MDRFGLIATLTAHLQGKNQAAWQRKIEELLSADPHTFSLPPIKILEVLRFDGIAPEHILTHISEKAGSTVDPRLQRVFELEKKRLSFALLKAQVRNDWVMIQFDPTSFGVEYDSYEQNEFGFNAAISYQKVVNAAHRLGFHQPDFFSALYFRNQFWDAHKRTEGTRYYMGCQPLSYEDGKSPVIPVLEFDRYKGWSLLAEDVGPDKPLDMHLSAGQGEHHSSTFVFYIPQ